MHLKKVSLFNFKNYEETDIVFSEKVNCFVGENGSGKTNLLDAIYYLALTKSAWNSVDSQNIRHGATFFSIKGTFLKEEKPLEVLCSLQHRQKKVIKVNKVDYEKLSEHIGRFPVVLIAPNDTDIIRDGSEVRRKFFDGIISQVNPQYLNDLLRYNLFLRQRNSLLKQFSEQNSYDQDLLEPYNNGVLSLGDQIFRTRAAFMERFLPAFLSQYSKLVEVGEQVSITYKSNHYEKNFHEIFLKAVKKDILLQRTTLGIHKDDYLFNIDDRGVKKFGSQGQQKSFLIALKLAQFEVIKEEKDFMPLLLLDDIFDKLDERRVARLMEMVAGKKFGQIFVTDTHAERAKDLFSAVGVPPIVFNVVAGSVKPAQ